MYKEQISVVAKDLEPPYNHVHHADQLKFLEKARANMLLSIGITLDSLYQLDLFPVIKTIKVDYLREVVEGEYTIVCRDFSWKNRSYLLKQQIFNSRDKRMMEARVELMFLSQKIKKAVLPPQDLILAFEDI